MKIVELRYKNFRNLIDNTFKPGENINVIYGENAQGKSNLLEAIWIFTGGRSFRGAKDFELVKFNEKKMESFLKISKNDRVCELNIQVFNKRRQVAVNSVTKKSPAELIGNFCSVVFSPTHLALLKEGPALRRKFLDTAICQIKPKYAKTLCYYNQILAQRNALLKDLKLNKSLLDTLDVWDEKLVQCAAELLKARFDYMEHLKRFARAFHDGISSHKEQLYLSYVSSFGLPDRGCGPGFSDSSVEILDGVCGPDFSDSSVGLSNRDFDSDFAGSSLGLLARDFDTGFVDYLRSRLKKARSLDVSLGFSTVGPHRDDIKILIDQKPAKLFASQGQQRSAVLAIKLSEAEILKSIFKISPVILLDDVMSELDETRQNFILNSIEKNQVFITCCEPSAALNLKSGNLFEVKNGDFKTSSVQ